ncbi:MULTISPECIES: DUF1292 domain-containing protein [Priestia]|jgi:uncharacterized protein YrzB (UPF0473 family)|uniref:UPF0473 protein BMQ_4608 n=8 Tax=Priestia TaxID=2800373 RepID=D5DT00_PRIM1|nr:MULTISPECIES: DUF1292 domain-containing protein [Priestia]AVX10487.1 DUF1292 domain-containing protein [Bacillus sp. Y-01]KOP76564.1 hypothetical protein AMS61_20220 [Bacillus sp. FJAT-21351]KQU14497.1 hypothetical protein ASG61_11855 [Bacillus sp. Leaf75]KRD89315.1 hypothetical protein ASE51_01560 [Bacillus sp. Root147]KRD92421.1 hypothetical protein ASE46_21660 [Bacillus sp. Root239]KRF57867.1 hypothetical protein ASG98_12790 [Bacillus sp. Soil531]MBK0007817.1 DUF1292 domain-containing 
MSVEENKITIVDENGNEQLCEILFTFDSDQYNKSYVIYYPIGADQDDEEEIEIHASAFTPSEDGQDGELQPIETEEEWDMVEEMVNTFLDEEGE